MKDTGITLKQLTNWMVNNRKRLWKPRIEARLQQQAQAAVAAVAAHAHAAAMSAVTLAQQAQAAQQQEQTFPSGMISSLVTPELGCSKPTVTMPTPSVNTFVKFDTESSNEHQVSQLKPVSPQPPLPSSADAATKALQSFLAHQHIKSVSLADAAEKAPSVVTESTTASSVNSNEDDVFDSAQFDREENEEVVTTFPAIEKPQNNPKNYARNVSFSSLEILSGYGSDSITGSSTLSVASLPLAVPLNVNAKRRRSRDTPDQPAVVTPRKKYRRVSLDMWVDACNKASHNLDESLPSFEEASRLFGFTK